METFSEYQKAIQLTNDRIELFTDNDLYDVQTEGLSFSNSALSSYTLSQLGKIKSKTSTLEQKLLALANLVIAGMIADKIDNSEMMHLLKR